MTNKTAGKQPDKYSTLSDAEIIVLYQQGDEGSGVALYYRYQTGMLHYAAVMVGPYLAQDVMQDTWEALIRRLRARRYREEQLFSKYIKSMVFRQSLVTLKVERRFGTTDEEPKETPDDVLNAEEELMKTESGSLLLRALHKVGKPAARILVLHVLYKKTFKEICSIMHIIREGTARVLYFRTLKELSMLLQPYRGML